MDKEKKLGGLKKRGHALESIGPNDKIIIFTNLGKSKKISFIAYTMVDEIVGDDKRLYNTFLFPKKLNLKGIKYFQNPIVASGVASKLDFVKNEEKNAEYYRSEFKEISREDFMTIIRGIPLDKQFPPYLKDISFSLDEFIKHTIEIFYKNFKSNKNKHKPKKEINAFLRDLKNTLNEYGIKVYASDLDKFYTTESYDKISKNFKNHKKIEDSVKLNDSDIAETSENNVSSYKYWIHNFPFKLLKDLHTKKKLAGLKKKGRILNNFSPSDRIIIFTSLNQTINFIACSKVDEIITNEESLYKTFFSPKKLSLECINYFSKPIVAKNLASNLNFVENVEKNANYYKSEFREISKGDFRTIVKGSTLDEKFPFYLKNISFSLDDFIENSIRILYNEFKSKKSKQQVEIKTFLKYLNSILNGYGIKISPEYLENFYAMNAFEFGFRHKPSIDADKSINLYNSTGKRKRFAYISLVD